MAAVGIFHPCLVRRRVDPDSWIAASSSARRLAAVEHDDGKWVPVPVLLQRGQQSPPRCLPHSISDGSDAPLIGEASCGAWRLLRLSDGQRRFNVASNPPIHGLIRFHSGGCAQCGSCKGHPPSVGVGCVVSSPPPLSAGIRLPFRRASWSHLWWWA
jgi:hypothetical protein